MMKKSNFTVDLFQDKDIDKLSKRRTWNNNILMSLGNITGKRNRVEQDWS